MPDVYSCPTPDDPPYRYLIVASKLSHRFEVLTKEEADIIETSLKNEGYVVTVYPILDLTLNEVQLITDHAFDQTSPDKSNEHQEASLGSCADQPDDVRRDAEIHPSEQ